MRPKFHSPERKPPRFKLDGFTPKAQSALNSVIEKVKNDNPSMKVKLVNKGKLQERHLADIINVLDSQTEGIQLVPNNDNQFLIKHVTVQDMIKGYTNELAKDMEQMLLSKGNVTVSRVLRSRDKADKKKSSAKTVSLKWSISLGDLRLQKKAEIERRISKGERFSIHVHGKKRPDPENPDHFTEFDANLDPFELKRRQVVVDELQGLLEQTETKFERKGGLKGLLMLTCIPKDVPTTTAKPSDKKQKPVEKKKKEEPEKAPKVEEEDLDALYSFKIEN
ncbi:Altered inheritance of mitochondria protein 23, mitochondrial [Yamadazyma tenuis]|nr:Altered inheritance of mitochondria protein 23, mitochondrial [Yamadazyma tenuis]